MRFWVAICALLAVSFAYSDASAADPRLRYRTIETPNFWVHYHSGTEHLAWKVAVAAEEAHTTLTPLLGWAPTQRTHVVIDDTVDTANGSAGVFGRQQINIFGMPPETDSVLGFYDDWLRVLVYHEYVHILQIDTVGGLPPIINALIGKQWLPGQTLPRWYIEGLATYYESAITGGGRVKSALFDMYLRTASLSGRFVDLGAATGFPTQWPTGAVAYLYGGYFLDYVFSQHGDRVGAEFNQRYNRRIFPWAINAISRDITGSAFEELWQEWKVVRRADALAKQIAVQAQGETQVRRITKRGGYTSFPRQRPGTNEIWFLHNDRETSPALSSVLPTGTAYKRVLELESPAGPFTFSPDGEEVVLAQSSTWQSSYRYLDLYAHGIDNGIVRRLTWGERAREPAVSPDGRSLVYVRNRGGTMELVLRGFRHPSGPSRVLVGGRQHEPGEPIYWQQIATPTWSPDGKRVAISWWRQDDGKRDLWIVDIETGASTRLTDDFAMDIDPYWADPETIYFSSDRSGIYNIYSIRPDGSQLTQLSNVVTGLFAPQPAPGNAVYASVYGADGFDLARFEPRSVPAAPSRSKGSQPDYPEVDTASFADRPYRAPRWTLPILLQPQIGVVTSGAGFGGSIVGGDPVGRHGYEVTAGVTTGREETDRTRNAAFVYRYAGLPVTIGLTGAFSDRPRTSGLFAENRQVPYVQRQASSTLSASYTFRALDDSVTLGGGFEVDHTDFAREPVLNHDPADLEPSAPDHGWFNQASVRLSYARRDAFERSVTTSRGWAGNISLAIQDPVIGSQAHRVTFGYGFDVYLQNPLAARHTLALQIDGAVSVAEEGDPRRYAIGGASPQDIFTSIVLQRQRRTFVVRGYEPGASAGDQFQVLQLSYRFPIWDIDAGFSTSPVFLRQLKGSVFMDNGTAYEGFLADASFLTGFGAELLLETVLAYYLFGNVRLGYARGTGPDGIHEVYALFGGGF